MKSIVQGIVKLVILICIVLGVALIVKTTEDRKAIEKEITQNNNNPKALILKKYLLGYNRPARVEVINLTEKFAGDVEEIKKMTLPLNPESNFYVRIQFFTDETDAAAPLVAQIRFLDVKSDNLVKEESINLEEPPEAK